MGFLGGAEVKNPPGNAGDARDVGLIPGLGRFPGGGNGSPLQYSYLGNPRDREPAWLQGMGSHRVGRDRVTTQADTHTRERHAVRGSSTHRALLGSAWTELRGRGSLTARDCPEAPGRGDPEGRRAREALGDTGPEESQLPRCVCGVVSGLESSTGWWQPGVL